MRQMTTDGKEIIIPDHCVYCNLDTGGAHEAGCPLYMDQEVIRVPYFNFEIIKFDLRYCFLKEEYH